jgi:O-antigen ligase
MQGPDTTALPARLAQPPIGDRLRYALSSPVLTRAAGVAAVIIISIAAGALAAYPGAVGHFFTANPAVWMGAAAIVWIAVVASGPVTCLAATAAAATAGGHISVAGSGGIDVSIGDLFFIPLVGWCLWIAVTQRRRPVPRVPMGKPAVLVFLGLAVLSLVYVAAVDPGRLNVSTVSLVRFCQTVTVAWLAATVVTNRRQLLFAVGAMALGAVAAVIGSYVEAISSGGNVFTDRFEALLGPNSVGLVGGMLVVLGLFSAFGPGWRQRAALIVIGALGLLIGKSVGSFVATGIAIPAGLALRQTATPLARLATAGAALGLTLVLALGIVQVLRPGATPGSTDFRTSSTSQRIIVGWAAVEMFERDPVFGVGWRRSDSPAVIGDRDIAFAVRARFQGANEEFFPDVTPTSVHNAYLQVLAELGVLGVLALGFMIAAVGAGMVRVVRSLPRGDPLWAPARALVLVALLVLVWLNDNPLYGGQVETVVLAVAVGGVLAIGRIAARRDAGEAAA